MTAAYTAAEKGVFVIVIEKSGVVGGNSLCSQQGINAADYKVQEALGMEFATAENLKTAQMSYGGREELVDDYVKVSGETIDLEYLQTFPHVPYGDTWMPPMAMPGGFMTSAIFVNQDAQRYTSEGFEVSDDTLKQEAAYAIFGKQISTTRCNSWKPVASSSLPVPVTPSLSAIWQARSLLRQ